MKEIIQQQKRRFVKIFTDLRKQFVMLMAIKIYDNLCFLLLLVTANQIRNELY